VASFGILTNRTADSRYTIALYSSIVYLLHKVHLQRDVLLRLSVFSPPHQSPAGGSQTSPDYLHGFYGIRDSSARRMTTNRIECSKAGDQRPEM
jgi:hypothetical protein